MLTKEFSHTRISYILKYEFSATVYEVGSPFPQKWFVLGWSYCVQHVEKRRVSGPDFLSSDHRIDLRAC